MKTLSQEAIDIIKDATEERKQAGLPHDRDAIAKLYDMYPSTVVQCLYEPGFEMGTTLARRIIRAHVEHLKARTRGELLTVLDNNARYKAGRR